eukprot:5078046-Pyramimonas_sp.AAC.1
MAPRSSSTPRWGWGRQPPRVAGLFFSAPLASWAPCSLIPIVEGLSRLRPPLGEGDCRCDKRCQIMHQVHSSVGAGGETGAPSVL